MKYYDCIVVLGCAPVSDQLKMLLKARVDKAIGLYIGGVSDKIILTGGKRRTGIDESLAMKKMIAGKIPKTKLILENESGTTYENAVNTKRIVSKMGFKSLIIITNGFHLQRARFIFNEVFYGYKLCFKQAGDKLSFGKKGLLRVYRVSEKSIILVRS